MFFLPNALGMILRQQRLVLVIQTSDPLATHFRYPNVYTVGKRLRPHFFETVKRSSAIFFQWVFSPSGYTVHMLGVFIEGKSITRCGSDLHNAREYPNRRPHAKGCQMEICLRPQIKGPVW